MIITYVINARIPTEKAHGLNTVVMCSNFAKIINKVELVVPKRSNYIKENLYNYYGVPNNFNIKYLPTIDFFNFEKYIGIVVFYIQFISFYISAFFYLLFFSGSKIIYTRNYQFSILNFFGKTIIYECHSLPRRKKIFINFCKRSDKIVVVTNRIKTELIKLGVQENKIILAPDAVDLSIFDIEMSKGEAREKLNLPINKIILVYTGKFKTMGVDKGIKDILEAMKGLDEKFFFVAVGGCNEDLVYYKKLASEFGVAARSVFLGHTTQKILAVYQKSADILLMPFPHNEHFAKYMSPIKMFEYMASKRPILASDLPTVKEILSDDTCFFSISSNPLSITEVIKKIINSPDISKEKAEKAFKEVKKYTWSKRANNIINFISAK